MGSAEFFSIYRAPFDRSPPVRPNSLLYEAGRSGFPGYLDRHRPQAPVVHRWVGRSPFRPPMGLIGRGQISSRANATHLQQFREHEVSASSENSGTYRKQFRTGPASRRSPPIVFSLALYESFARSPIEGAGGGGGIRTHEGLSSLPVFKTGAFNHSATPPSLINQEFRCLELSSRNHDCPPYSKSRAV